MLQIPVSKASEASRRLAPLPAGKRILDTRCLYFTFSAQTSEDEAKCQLWGSLADRSGGDQRCESDQEAADCRRRGGGGWGGERSEHQGRAGLGASHGQAAAAGGEGGAEGGSRESQSKGDSTGGGTEGAGRAGK